MTKLIPGDQFSTFTIQHYYPGQHTKPNSVVKLEQAIASGEWRDNNVLPECWKSLVAKMGGHNTSQSQTQSPYDMSQQSSTEAMQSAVLKAPVTANRTSRRLSTAEAISYSQQTHRASADTTHTATNPTHATNASNCRYANVDILIVAKDAEFPLLSFLLRSIDLFMPCYNTLHLVLDGPDLKNALPWTTKIGPSVRLYPFEPPPEVASIGGYILQGWVMLWGDNFTLSTGAEYLMIYDSDSVLAMPVTCASLFDDQGRVYQQSWDMHEQKHFVPTCLDFIGRGDGVCKRSYMSTFPFVMPVRAYLPMRTHFQTRVAPLATYFNAAFGQYSNNQTGTPIRHFSQFVVMGEYLRLHQAHLVHQIYCPKSEHVKWLLNESANCVNFVPLGLHYGHRNSRYVMQVNMSRNEHGFHRGNTGELNKYSRKFGLAAIRLIQDVTKQGFCLKMLFHAEKVGKRVVAADGWSMRDTTVPSHGSQSGTGGSRNQTDVTVAAAAIVTAGNQAATRTATTSDTTNANDYLTIPRYCFEHNRTTTVHNELTVYGEDYKPDWQLTKSGYGPRSRQTVPEGRCALLVDARVTSDLALGG
jgi:hypothetical protein